MRRGASEGVYPQRSSTEQATKPQDKTAFAPRVAALWLVALLLVGSKSAAAILPSSRLATSQNRCNKLYSILPSGEYGPFARRGRRWPRVAFLRQCLAGPHMRRGPEAGSCRYGAKLRLNHSEYKHEDNRSDDPDYDQFILPNSGETISGPATRSGLMNS